MRDVVSMKKKWSNEETEKQSYLHVVLDLGDLGLDAGDGLLERGVDGVLALVPHEPASIHPSSADKQELVGR